MKASVEQITHEQLMAWRCNDANKQLSVELKKRLEVYYTIHRSVINSVPKSAIFKTLHELNNISKSQFDYIYPLAISFFNSESKLTKRDFLYILYEKMNKGIAAAWEAREIEMYNNAVRDQSRMVNELWEDEKVKPEDVKQPVFIITINSKDFGYDRPTDKEIIAEIEKYKKIHGITNEQAKKVLLDANVKDVDYEEIAHDTDK
jgi:hypothetical protein